jgi:hypothetical protein
MRRDTFYPERAGVHPKSGIWLDPALQVYFPVLEMFPWTKLLGLKTFRNSLEKATALRPSAAGSRWFRRRLPQLRRF